MAFATQIAPSFGLNPNNRISQMPMMTGLPDTVQRLLLGQADMRKGFVSRTDKRDRQDLLSNLGDLGIGFGGGGMGGAGGAGSGGMAGGYQELSDSLLGQIQQQGGSQRDRINESFDTSLNSSLARLYDRGFGNSSLVETTQQGSDRQRQFALNDLSDSLLSQQIGVQSPIGLAGLNAQQNQQRFQQQLFGNLFGGIFG